MAVKVKFLAVLKPLAQAPEISLNLPISCLKELVGYLAETQPRDFVNRFLDPESNWIRSDILVFINGVDARLLGMKSAKLKHGDEVVFLPTVHGGVLPAHL